MVRNESRGASVSARCVSAVDGRASRSSRYCRRTPRRRHALLLAVDNDVWIAGSKEVAQAAEGSTAGSFAFYLPKGVPVPIINKGAWWAAATTTATVSRISVMVDKDDRHDVTRQAAQPGLTWRKHYRPGEFAPMHPLGQRAISPVSALPAVQAFPGRTWRLHFRPGSVHPVHYPQPVPGPEPIQGFDIVPIYHAMVM